MLCVLFRATHAAKTRPRTAHRRDAEAAEKVEYLERGAKTRARPGAGRSDLAEHDVYGGHRAICGDPDGRQGDGRTGKPAGVGCRGAAGGFRRVHLGGTGRGDAAGGRKLRLFARSLRSAALGADAFFFVHLADAFSGAAEHRVGGAGVRGLFDVPGGEVEPARGNCGGARDAQQERHRGFGGRCWSLRCSIGGSRRSGGSRWSSA